VPPGGKSPEGSSKQPGLVEGPVMVGIALESSLVEMEAANLMRFVEPTELKVVVKEVVKWMRAVGNRDSSG